MAKPMRIPRMVLTSERWSNTVVVVFDDDLDMDIVPNEWVYNRIEEAEDQGRELKKEEALAELIDELHEDNDPVDEYWIDEKICRCGCNYYKYNENGTAKRIDEYIRDEYIREEK